MLTYAEPPMPDAAIAAVRARGDVPRSAARTWVWAWVRVLAGLGILAVLVWRVGTAGILDGLRVINAGTLAAAFGIGLLTTVLSAWRWCLVARGLGVSLPLRGAAADYYRALFLNLALPGGILGDVHRAVRHGRDVGNLGLGVRTVVLERSSGQVVFIAAGVMVLLAFPSPALPLGRLVTIPPALAVALAAAVIAVAVVVGLWLRGAVSVRWVRALRTGVSALRRGLLAREIWPGVVLSSVAVLAGCLATFLLAARATGVTAPTVQLLPLMMLALFAMSIPLNVVGLGPREGALAWAFGAAGLGAAQGVTVAVVYGLSVFVASLPGAAVLAIRWYESRRPVDHAAAYRSDSA
jgi:uncharacterized membrane protein YbhN (UPF0104 family)